MEIQKKDSSPVKRDCFTELKVELGSDEKGPTTAGSGQFHLRTYSYCQENDLHTSISFPASYLRTSTGKYLRIYSLKDIY